MDYLKDARTGINASRTVAGEDDELALYWKLDAIACAVVALVEQVEKLTMITGAVIDTMDIED